tara:strand:- start:233 stop:745 length:513 start_codon:yes stop_codon:yes gene_type:complete
VQNKLWWPPLLAALKALPVLDGLFQFPRVVRDGRDVLPQRRYAVCRNWSLWNSKLCVHLSQTVHAETALEMTDALPRGETRHVLFCNLLNARVRPCTDAVEWQLVAEDTAMVFFKVVHDPAAVDLTGEQVGLVAEAKVVSSRENHALDKVVEGDHFLNKKAYIFQWQSAL